jgi:hypothetical protein
MKRLIFLSLSTLAFSTILMPTAFANACSICTSTGPTNPSPRQSYVAGGE